MPDGPELNNVGSVNYREDMITVKHLIESFSDALTISVELGQIKPNTKAFYLFQLKKLKAKCGEYPAADLRVHNLVGVKITNHFARALKRLYTWAMDEELITKDPFRKLKIPRTGQRTRILTDDERSVLLNSCNDSFRQLLELSLETAGRPVEIRTLRWHEVNFHERLIIRKDFKSKDQRRDGKGVRQIPLSVRAVEILNKLVGTRHPENEEDYVFRGRRGEPYSANRIQVMMRDARKKAGLNAANAEKVVCYTMRHTRATDLTRLGVRDNTLAEILGHSNTNMTRRYQHLTGTDLCNRIDEADQKKTSK